MIFKFGCSAILLMMAYGAYKLFMGVLDFDDEESFYIGARILITSVCLFIVLCAVGLLFAGGAE